MIKTPCPCGQHKYHTIGADSNLTVPASTASAPLPQNAIVAGQTLANTLQKSNTYNVANAGNVIAATATGATVGASVGGPVGAIIGAIVNTTASLVGGSNFWTTDSAAQTAEDDLGQVINQLSGGTLIANWTDPVLQNALNSLIYQDMTQNPSAWQCYLRSYGLPPYNTTDPQALQFCNGGSWGMNCIWTVLLHTKPAAPSFSTAAPRNYINCVVEFLTNLTKYLTGLGYTALANQVNVDVVNLQVAQQKINAKQILQAQAAAQSASGIPAVSTATLATAAPMVLLGLAALAVFLTSPKKGKENA